MFPFTATDSSSAWAEPLLPFSYFPSQLIPNSVSTGPEAVGWGPGRGRKTPEGEGRAKADPSTFCLQSPGSRNLWSLWSPGAIIINNKNYFFLCQESGSVGSQPSVGKWQDSVHTQWIQCQGQRNQLGFEMLEAINEKRNYVGSWRLIVKFSGCKVQLNSPLAILCGK